MTRTRVPPVLVTGATGRVGRVVVGLLIDAGVPVRVLTHRSEAAATLPANVEVVTGDLTVPESLDAGLRGVSAVFLGAAGLRVQPWSHVRSVVPARRRGSVLCGLQGHGWVNARCGRQPGRWPGSADLSGAGQ